jgi:hypothetical protein
MSWQSYVDDQLLATKVVTKAVIAGHDGSVWAASEGFKAGGRPIYQHVCTLYMILVWGRSSCN